MAEHDHDAQHGHHVIPQKLLLRVFLALLVLTALTYLTAEYVDLGPLNVPLAIAIASTKAALVVMFFMALKFDSKVNTLVFSLGTVFVVIFLGLTMLDTLFRGDLTDYGAETIMDTERREEALRARDPGEAGLRGVVPADSMAAAPADSLASQSDVAEPVDPALQPLDTEAAAPASPAPGRSGETGE